MVERFPPSVSVIPKASRRWIDGADTARGQPGCAAARRRAGSAKAMGESDAAL